MTGNGRYETSPAPCGSRARPMLDMGAALRSSGSPVGVGRHVGTEVPCGTGRHPCHPSAKRCPWGV